MEGSYNQLIPLPVIALADLGRSVSPDTPKEASVQSSNRAGQGGTRGTTMSGQVVDGLRRQTRKTEKGEDHLG